MTDLHNCVKVNIRSYVSDTAESSIFKYFICLLLLPNDLWLDFFIFFFFFFFFFFFLSEEDEEDEDEEEVDE